MQTLYIHIGYHKTGTTSLQSLMNQNRQELFDLGVFYPAVKGDGSRDYYQKHLEFYIALKNAHRNGSDISEPVDKITGQIVASGAHVSMLSEESFSGLDLPILDALTKFRLNFNVKIIAIVRRQDKFLQSFYQQSIKDFGEQRDFPVFLKETKWHRLYFDAALGHWADRFGPENMHVFSYDLASPEKPVNQAILDLVLDGRRPDFTSEDRTWNTSLPAICYEAVKYFNRTGAPKSDRVALANTLRKCLRSRRVIENPLLKTGLAKEYLTPTISQIISDTFHESNARTAEIYFEGVSPFAGMNPHSAGNSISIKDIQVTRSDFAPKDVIGLLSHLLIDERAKVPPKTKA